MDHTICLRNRLVLIAQNGKIQTDGLREPAVGVGRVTTGSKQGNIEAIEARSGGCRQVDISSVFELDDEGLGTSAGTQRVALAGSTTRESLGKPRQDDDLFAQEI